MVTHEINPILRLVDRVLYLVSGRWAVGNADEIMTSASFPSSIGPTSMCSGCADGSSSSARPDSPDAEVRQSHYHHPSRSPGPTAIVRWRPITCRYLVRNALIAAALVAITAA